MQNTLNKISHHSCHFFAHGFGAGFLPYAPGTWGTVVAVPIVLAMQMISAPWYVVMTVCAFGLGVVFCGVTARDLQQTDPGSIVWDEIVGLMIAAWFITLTAWTVLLVFLLFRFFDILKPWPIRYLEQRIPGGLGIMLDDAVAGIYAGLFAFFMVQFSVFV